MVLLALRGDRQRQRSRGSRWVLTTAVFFLGYGAGLLLCAWQLTRRASWARSPVILAQLIQLGLAWSFWGGDTTLVAIALAVVALVVGAGVLHPDSMRALADERAAARPPSATRAAAPGFA